MCSSGRSRTPPSSSLAHELLHLWQAEHGRPIDARYPGIKLLCERDADAYVVRMLRRYRFALKRPRLLLKAKAEGVCYEQAN
jgi:hypothetical protein